MKPGRSQRYKAQKRSVFVPKDLGGINTTQNCNISYKVKMIMKNKFCPLKVLLKQVVRDLEEYMEEWPRKYQTRA